MDGDTDLPAYGDPTAEHNTADDGDDLLDLGDNIIPILPSEMQETTRSSEEVCSIRGRSCMVAEETTRFMQ